MLFADLFFLYFFLPACLIFYFISKNICYRNTVLIIFSLVFYAWGEPVRICLLLISVTANFFAGLIIDKYRNTAFAKTALICSIVLNIGMLAVFKYSGFFIENLNMLLRLNLPVPDITLPIGISFFTFQAMSYTIDCYLDTADVQHNYAKFLLFVSLFPQLVAGPIVRYSDIQNEIDLRRTDINDLSYGFMRLIAGLAKKVIIANNLSTVLDELHVIPPGDMSVAASWTVAFVFALQVYFDFSGYSDMAIGMGRIFGFHFKENFNYPFISVSIGEFWQRWHISLGAFFRDYLLYIPVFGKRRGYLNLFIVWLCTGLWHGAAWNYIIWGLYFGFFIFIENIIGGRRLKRIPAPVMHIYNKIVIVVGFGIFYYEEPGALFAFVKNIFGLNFNALTDVVTNNLIFNNCFLIGTAVLFSLPVIKQIKKLKFVNENALEMISAASCMVLLFISSIMLVNATNNPFLYFWW
jgi:alginate O-acetyltransferase complex protein AlgI